MIPVIGGFSDLAEGLSCYFVVCLLDGKPVIDFEVLYFFAGNELGSGSGAFFFADFARAILSAFLRD